MKKSIFKMVRKFFAVCLSVSLAFLYIPVNAWAQEAVEKDFKETADSSAYTEAMPQEQSQENLDKLIELVESSDADEGLKKGVLEKLQDANPTFAIRG